MKRLGSKWALAFRLGVWEAIEFEDIEDGGGGGGGGATGGTSELKFDIIFALLWKLLLGWLFRLRCRSACASNSDYSSKEFILSGLNVFNLNLK